MTPEIYQFVGAIVGILSLIGVVQWRNEHTRGRLYERLDQHKDKIERKLREEYVQKNVHDLINNQHENEIYQLKKDIHEIKVSLEAIGKNVSILVSKSNK